MTADGGYAVFFFGSAIYRDRFAKDVAITDDDLGRRTLIRKVLRFGPNDNTGKKMVVATDRRMARQRDPVLELCAPSNPNMRTDDAVMTYPNVIVEFSSRIHHGSVCNYRWHEADPGRFYPPASSLVELEATRERVNKFSSFDR
jgi:hypothetical protein